MAKKNLGPIKMTRLTGGTKKSGPKPAPKSPPELVPMKPVLP